MKHIFSLTALGFTLAGSFLFAPQLLLSAAGALTVSVTPPLFQLTIGPGEFWASSVKIINTNETDVAYYATVVNFEPSGENGRGAFLPLVEELDDPSLAEHTLARWITISKDPVLIPQGQSAEIPFEVRIPEDASPGGHYAAILIGTQPPQIPSDGPTVSVSSFVSSLIFVRIKGDVIEKARIREFISEQSLYEKPEAKFILRFENLGTVHLQPRGDITIYNTWGRERGKVLINQKTNFGNVLPKSIRKFEFSWSGEFSPLDIGPYRAVATLAYGDSVKQHISATTYFWVIPLVPLAITGAVLLAIVGAVVFFVRSYIRRVLELEAARLVSRDAVPHVTMTNLTLPLREGVIDLRHAVLPQEREVSHEEALPGSGYQHRPLTLFELFSAYRLLFAFFAFITVGIILAVWYFEEALLPARTFEISNVTMEEELLSPGE